jgi:hypothetical protein
MTDKEKQLAEKYPEAAIFAAIAGGVWRGSKAVVKMELQVDGSKNPLENALIRCLMLAENRPLGLTSKTTLNRLP